MAIWEDWKDLPAQEEKKLSGRETTPIVRDILEKISKCRERLEQECDDAPDNSQAPIEGRGYKKTREGHDENSDDEPHDLNDDNRKKKKSKAAKADAGKKIQDAAMNVCMHACLY